YTHSIGMTHQLLDGEMYPLTLAGMEQAIKSLSD
ncbi:hypothetical protein C8D97_11098, partial [Pleionea mediterranea]